jgi:sec-independent protein translocase protein TatA
MEGLRPTELIIVLAIIALLFGGSKLPQLGAGLGKAIRGFKDAMAGKDEDPSAGTPAPPQAGASRELPPERKS